MTALQKTVLFMHIPKTGGTTFSDLLAQNYAPTEVLTLDGASHRAEIERFAEMNETKRATYRLIQGHLHFGFHQFVPGESIYLTCLREPVARAVSFYAYARNQPDHYLHPLFVKDRLDLKGLLERKATPELFNHQTRMVAGSPRDRQAPVGRAELEIAKQNLTSHFLFVGLTEEFDAGLMLMSRMFGWTMPLYVKRNVTEAKIKIDSLDAETHAMLREANALDLELHRFALELFEARRRAAGAGFESELKRFQELNAAAADNQDRPKNFRQRLKSLFRKDRQSIRRLNPSAIDTSV